MTLKIIRRWLTELSAESEWFIDDLTARECYGLEDTDRGLDDSMTEGQILAIKVWGKTAIPTGIYPVIMRFSPKHKRDLPTLVGVKGFTYVEIHPGNKPEDTDACLLPGRIRGHNFVGSSVLAFDALLPKIVAAVGSPEGCYVQILRAAA